MTAHVRVSGSIREIRSDGLHVRVGSGWRQVQEGYTRVSGSWRTFHVADSTGPAAVGNMVVRWTATGLLTTWTAPPDPDLYSYTVQIRHWGESTVRYSGWLPGDRTSWLTNFYAPYYQPLLITIIPYDVLGNIGTARSVASMAHTGAPRGRVPSPIDFYSSTSGTWRGGQWRTDLPGSTLVFQGSSVSGKSQGAYFYGDQIYNALRGTTITDASFQYVRTNSTGLGGAVEPELYMSTISSKAQAWSAFGAKVTGPGVCRNGDCLPYNTVTLPASWRAPMVDPSAPNRFRAVVMSSDDETLQSWLGNVSLSYAAFYAGDARPIANNVAVPGRIRIAHTG